MASFIGQRHARVLIKNIWSLWNREQAARRAERMGLHYTGRMCSPRLLWVSTHRLNPTHFISIKPIFAVSAWQLQICACSCGDAGGYSQPDALFRLGRVVEEDGLDHAWEDLGHMDADNLRDHLGEVDTRLQGLSLDEEIIGELVQFPHNLRREKKKKKNYR